MRPTRIAIFDICALARINKFWSRRRAKVLLADTKFAISLDALFAMAMIVGEGKPCLIALMVLNRSGQRRFAASLLLDPVGGP